MSHYRTRLLCRVPETLGKGRKTLGKEVAECSTRRSAHGLSSTGENGNAECLFSSTRQIFAVCHAALGKKNETGRPNGERNGWDGMGAELRRVLDSWHSAKIQSSPSARYTTLGEVWIFAECHASGTRRSLDLHRVPHVWHSAKFQTSPSA